uniref:RING-type E3 ubiquitin transferase n=1 Tax=Gallus gallus TaxID=9031 RepID=A0A8V0XAP5_CHICK
MGFKAVFPLSEPQPYKDGAMCWVLRALSAFSGLSLRGTGQNVWILGLFPPALWGSIPRGWGSLSIRSSPLCRSAFLLVLMVVAVDLSISHHSLSDHTPFQLFFYFEHSILLAAVLTTISRYVLHLLEPHCGALQENRDSCALCFSFCSGLIRALLYVGFIVSMIGTRTFPLFAAQSACLAVTQFKKAAVDLFVLHFADPSGNTLLPGATPEALPAEDNACVICREEMGPEVTALPCCHVFHTSCLRSWFRQQWTCPMCRMPVQRVFYPELMPPDPPAQPPDPPARPQTPPRTSPAPEPQNWDSYEEEEEEEEQRQPLGRTLNQEMIWVYQECFTRLEDENMAAWLLRCYDSGAKGVNLEGRQLRRLGSLSNEPALDRLICRREDSSFTLWKRMLSAVRQRYRNRKYVTPRASPWFTLDEGIQRLRQLAVVEMLYADSFDPDDPRADDCPDTTKCTPQMWWQLAVSAPSDLVATMTAVQCMYHNPASVMMLTCALQDYDRNVASIQRRCVTLLEELAREVQKLSREVEQCKKAKLCSSSSPSNELVVRDGGQDGRPSSPALALVKDGCVPRLTFWFYLRDHGEDMRRWDGKPTSALQRRVEELLRRPGPSRGSSRRRFASRRRDACGSL